MNIPACGPSRSVSQISELTTISTEPRASDEDNFEVREICSRIFSSSEQVYRYVPLPAHPHNHLWRIETETRRYLLRLIKAPISSERFNFISKAYVEASACGVGPKLRAIDKLSQAIIVYLIDAKEFDPVAIDSELFEKTVNALITLQGAWRNTLNATPNALYQLPPLSYLKSDRDIPKNNVPFSLWICLDKVRVLFTREIETWYETNAAAIHGNFCRRHVLVPRDKAANGVVIVDFDQAKIGHPLFDLVQFSLRLPHNQREELLKQYLKTDQITDADRTHFEFNHLLLLLDVGIQSYHRAREMLGSGAKLMSAEAMDRIIRDDDAPPFEIADDQYSPTSLQERGTFALAELSRRCRQKSIQRSQSVLTLQKTKSHMVLMRRSFGSAKLHDPRRSLQHVRSEIRNLSPLGPTTGLTPNERQISTASGLLGALSFANAPARLSEQRESPK